MGGGGKVLWRGFHSCATTNETEGYTVESWPNTAARRTPGWLEESDPAGCDFVRDGRSIPPAFPHGQHHLSSTECTENTVMSYVTQGRHGLCFLSGHNNQDWSSSFGLWGGDDMFFYIKTIQV